MKLSAYSIIILGFAIGIVVLSYGYFQHWMPKSQDAAYQNELADLRTKEINKTKAAEDKFAKAVKMRNDQAAAWQVFVAQNTPSTSLATDGIDLSVDPWQLAMDAGKFRDRAQMHLNAQLRVGGVKVLSGPEIPAPEANSTTVLASYFNLGQFTYPIVIWELGTVRVSGTYKQITDNVRAWSRMKGYLAVVDGLAITGTDTPLEATYNLVLVGYLKGKKFFGGVNEGAAVASTAGMGGPGGPMGGGPAGIRPGPAAGGGGGPMGGPGGIKAGPSAGTGGTGMPRSGPPGGGPGDPRVGGGPGTGARIRR